MPKLRSHAQRINGQRANIIVGLDKRRPGNVFLQTLGAPSALTLTETEAVELANNLADVIDSLPEASHV